MGLLDRFRRDRDDAPGPPPPEPEHLRDNSPAMPLAPESRRIGEEERARIDTALEALAAEDVDVDDLASIGGGLDRALARWTQKGGSGHDAIVERYGVGIGEHLARTTDLAWEVVTDSFGTDLAVAAGDFVVVPHNLVAVRWMRRETGWVPSVVGHLVTLRTR
ncbi:DUF3806 domain-containing protein [Ornithinimicrobium flavum]|uniref:DUF3806 domain-containing protein n=1 Tax=Ornithinimicrobium flavum TaxID=1288636 RepID=UPI00106FB8C8|nr:DUF3806 domain-containing protein [Ornithinimicrobium flavum]